jgi:hypothetical protein
MSYVISQLHIEDIDREGVTPEEAVRRLLRGSLPRAKTPAEELIGLFSRDEDAALIDEAMETARASRRIDAARDFGS